MTKLKRLSSANRMQWLQAACFNTSTSKLLRKGIIMSNFTDQLSGLSPEHLQDLASRLLAKRGAAKHSLEDDRITRRAQSGLVVPLSSAQEGLWLQEGLGAGVAYNESIALHLEGELDVQALEHSLIEIVRRHDILRSRILTTEEGAGEQVVDPPGRFRLTIVDLLSEASELNESVRQYAAKHLNRPFDLARGPLLMAHLLKFGETNHVLCWTAHHIVWDLWSLGIMLNELDSLYTSFVTGHSSLLPPLKVQYSDYALWQREWLQSSEFNKQASYWHQQLAGTQLPLNLPLDFSRPAQPSFRGGSLWFAMPRERASSLKELSRQESATLFMTLLAAFVLLLSRWSGQNDVIVGSPIAGRKRKPVESMIGLFVNLLPLRTQMHKSMTFRQLLASVKKTTLDAFANQEVPFEKLAGALYGERHAAGQPLQVIFAMQNQASGLPVVAGLKATVLEIESRTAKFDLLLEIFETDAGLSGRVGYAEDLFRVDTIERLIESFQTLVAAVTNNPDSNIYELPLLNEQRQNQLIVEWNRTARPYPSNRCIHELLQDQVELTPGKAAVVCGEDSLTYGELNLQSNSLARFLIENGLQIGEPVALLMDRSPRMIVALAAILKAGGAYLPIDTLYPASRIDHLLVDGGVRIVLTDPQYESKIPTARDVLTFMPAAMSLTGYDTTNLNVHVPPESCAYIIYTSGSTGGPKGVAVPHTAVNRLVRNNEYVPFREGFSILSTGSVAFDASTFEIWGALLNGGCLIMPEERVLDGETLDILSRRHPIDSAFLTAALFNSILDTTPDALGGIRHLLVGGEALSVHHVARAVRQMTDTRLYNGYGPTESTTFACTYPIPPDFDSAGHSSVPIGRPIANTQTYILDESLNPVPIGVEGELFIGGAGLAICYWRQPALTAEKFLPNPFAFGERMYRTGDRARYLPDGNIEYAGRIDLQVKVRGFRVELGEIERVLLGHFHVHQACVLARESGSHRKLAAYVVADEFDAQELRSYLLQSLPEYMVPANFVRMERLPITGNGKVDFKALPEPDFDEIALQRYVPPRTYVESQLCELFAATLNLDRVGIRDNFFLAGGDSIFAIQIVARARQVGIQFSMRDLFRLQTIEEISRVATRANIVDSPEEYDDLPFPLTATPLKVLEFMGADFVRNVPVTVWECSRHISPHVLDRAVRSLITRHDALRLKLIHEGDSWSLCHTSAENAAEAQSLEHLHLGSLTSVVERSSAIKENATRLSLAVDPAKPPLFKAMLLEFGDAQRLLLAIHHLGFDPVSLTLLLRDLENLYLWHETDHEIELEPRTTSYRTWARRIAQYADSPEMEAQRKYWRSLPWERCRPLPPDIAQEPESASLPDCESAALSEAETSRLFECAQRDLRMQVEDVLLTALAAVLAEWTGSQVVLLDRMHHGRVDLFRDLDVSQTAGWFSTENPIVLDLSNARGMEEFLAVARDHVNELGNGGIGYGILRYQKKDPEFVSLPVAQVRLNHLGRMGSDSRESLFKGRFDELEAEASSKLDRLIEVRTLVHDGSLQLQWLYDRAVHSPKTIRDKARSLVDHLIAISSLHL
jgi:amino acid adenylation domain-containing protein/non-ribosomal peptide synthase protein (TIGR01720 family)